MKFLSCAYREWGIRTHTALVPMFPHHEFSLVQSPEALNAYLAVNGLPDAIFCIGWSWILDASITDNCYVVGIHPSDLPNFAGGSPIQNQILNGVTLTKNSLFRLTSKLDQGAILGKVPLSLEGHMQDIFTQLTTTGFILLVDFIRAFPDHITPLDQDIPPEHKTVKRLKPDASRLTHNDIKDMTARELYDFVRCREDPYPNAFIEDETGRLLIKFCEFKAS